MAILRYEKTPGVAPEGVAQFAPTGPALGVARGGACLRAFLLLAQPMARKTLRAKLPEGFFSYYPFRLLHHGHQRPAVFLWLPPPTREGSPRQVLPAGLRFGIKTASKQDQPRPAGGSSIAPPRPPRPPIRTYRPYSPRPSWAVLARPSGIVAEVEEVGYRDSICGIPADRPAERIVTRGNSGGWPGGLGQLPRPQPGQ